MKSFFKIIILFVILHINSFGQNDFTLEEAQKAYVKGDWEKSALAYGNACSKEVDSLKGNCLLWNILALSQTGNAKLFKQAGHRLDSLIQNTSKDKALYSELLLTKAQFMLYMGKNKRAVEILIEAINFSKEEQFPIFRKVCSVVLSKNPSEELEKKCSLSSKAILQVQPPPLVKKNEMDKNDSTKIILEKNEAEKQPPSQQNSSFWVLQLGAFGVETNAKILIENLKKQGIDGFLETRIGETRTLFLVQTGKFSSKEDALEYGRQKLAPLNMEFQPILKK